MNNKQKKAAPLYAWMAFLLIFTIVFNYLSLTKFDNIFEKFFGSTASTLKGDTTGLDVNYYKSDFGSASDI